MVEVEWTALEIAALRSALKRSLGEFSRLLHVTKRTVTLWENGGTRKPQAANQRSLDDLLANADARARSRFERALAEARGEAGFDVADRGGDTTKRRDALRILGIGGLAATGMRDVVLGAARESAMLSSTIDRRPVESGTLSEFAETLHRLASDYVLSPDLDRIFLELTVLRDRVAAVIDRAGRLTDLQDLYVLLAATCTLLASVSHDLAEPHAAMIQTDTAAAFAKLAGHSSLENWVYCTRAMIASWWGSPEQVLQEAGKAVQVRGISQVRLSGLVARAHSQIGNREAATAAMDAARRERERLPANESLTELGPVFAFSPARQHYYNASTYARLGEWSRAKSESESVISLYSPTSVQKWPATLTLAQATLARAELHLDGAGAALTQLVPVLEIPTGQRIPQVQAALNSISGDLHSMMSTPHCRALDEAVRSFAPTKELHAQ